MGTTHQNPAITHILATDARIAALEKQVRDLIRVVETLQRPSVKLLTIKEAAAKRGVCVNTFNKLYGDLIVRPRSGGIWVKESDLI